MAVFIRPGAGCLAALAAAIMVVWQNNRVAPSGAESMGSGAGGTSGAQLQKPGKAITVLSLSFPPYKGK